MCFANGESWDKHLPHAEFAYNNDFRSSIKLAPRYVDPFRMIEKCGPVVYQLKLPEQLRQAYNVFHVFQRKRCLRAPSILRCK
jgi:hypothetical protein